MEIGLLCRVAEVAAAGQTAAYQSAHVGLSELALFSQIRLAMEEFAGERVPLAGDLLSGRLCTAGITGWPTSRVIEAGDPVIVDLAPRVAGYWGDSCGTFIVGSATPRFDRMFRSARTALDLALVCTIAGRWVAIQWCMSSVPKATRFY